MRNSVLFGAVSVAALLACGDADPGTGLQRHSVGSTDPTSPDPASESANAAEPGGGAASGDAGAAGGGSKGDAGSSTPSDGGPKTCIDGVASPGSGQHHAGADCASCHDSLGSSRKWTIAGTLYSAATGGTAVSGATIVVVDAAGKTIKLQTYSNGNFYTTTAVTKPLKVRATKCPGDLSMTASASNGSCNASGCHDSTMRIHVP